MHCLFKGVLRNWFYVVLVFSLEANVSAQALQDEKKLNHKYAFEALPIEKREEFLRLRIDAQKDFIDQNYSTCLLKTIMAEKVFGLDSQIFFLRGLCYAQCHDQKKTVIAYQKVLEVDPDNAFVNANLLEIYFFSKDYEKGLVVSDKLRTLYPNAEGDSKLPQESVPLLEFKRFIILNELVDKQPALIEKVKELSKLYDYMDDNPYSYFVKALKYYNIGNKAEGDLQVGIAVKIFGLKRTLAWTKAMTDSGSMEAYDYGVFLELAKSEYQR